MTSASLSQIETLLETIISLITEDTQYDEIASLMVSLEIMVNQHSQLAPFYVQLLTEIYRAKGALYETLNEFIQLKHECFNLKMFYLCRYGAEY